MGSSLGSERPSINPYSLHRIRSQISRSEHNRIARRDPGFAQPLHAGEKLFLSPGQNVAREYEIHFPEKCRRRFYRKPVAWSPINRSGNGWGLARPSRMRVLRYESVETHRFHLAGFTDCHFNDPPPSVDPRQGSLSARLFTARRWDTQESCSRLPFSTAPWPSRSLSSGCDP